MFANKIKIGYLIAFFLLSILGCENKKQNESMDPYGPKMVEANGYVVPPKSLLPPNIIAVKGVKSITAGKPKVIQLHSNITPVGKPSVIKLGTPINICILGQGPYKLPVIDPVIDSSFIAGLPEIVDAYKPQIIDFTTASFSSFNTLQGLKNNIILSIFQDKTGNIWIGSWGGGIAKYNGRSFTHYSTTQGLSSDMVNKILEDRNGNLWFGTYNGVNKYDGKALTIFATKEGIRSKMVTDLLEDKIGNIWICTHEGVYKYNGKSFTIFTDDLGLGIHFNRIIQDNSGNVWFKTDDGFCKFDGSTFINYSVPEASWEDLKTSILDNKYDGNSFGKLPLSQYVNIYKSERGYIWYASDNGIFKYDGNNCIQLGLTQEFNGANLNELLEDKNGNLWIGSNGGGLAKCNGLLFTHIRSVQGLSSESIRSIIADKNGNIWVGTWGGGVNKYDGKSISQYTTDQGLSSNNITAISEDKNGNIWFGTWGNGVDKFNGETFTNYSETQGLSSLYINTILEDRKGNMWFGTSDGVIKYHEESFTELNIKSLGVSDVPSVLEDKYGNIWFGTANGGVFKYDGKLFTHFNTANGMNDMTVHSMLEDKYGNIWFGTANGGVNKYDGKIFTQYTVDQGLANNNVNSILEDKAGYLWFGTPNGLSRMNLSIEGGTKPKSGKVKDSRTSLFKNYLFSDGFLGIGTWDNSLIQDKNGIIWAGTTDRITAYHPEEDFPDSIPPHIQLSGISLFNEDINWIKVEKNMDTVMQLKNGTIIKNFNFSNISKWSYTPEQLELINSNNFITFKFIGITTNKPERIKYQFMLEGLDATWSPVTANPEATYTNLSHGAYIFRVKAVNSEGYWSNELRYPFKINPPWWLSWWAYSIYALIFIFGVRIVHVYQKQRVIHQEREKAQKRELAQAKEIEKAYLELKATQSQLIQSEKMASLGELTAGIAHEIQNPLNFVNNFSEVNKELLAEMNEEIEKVPIFIGMAELKALINDVIENEEKILHHGKRADGIVKGMLQHSRISSGVKEPTDINKLADEYLRLAYHGLRAKDKSFNATLKTDFDQSIGTINVIPQDIGRALLNLITNAFYAVEEKKQHRLDGYESTVSITTKKAGGKVFISVKDNGNGISPIVLDKIFQPFFTTKPTGQGTGLGLSMSYDIVKAHGGELRVETKEGEGAEFIILIPMNQ